MLFENSPSLATDVLPWSLQGSNSLVGISPLDGEIKEQYHNDRGEIQEIFKKKRKQRQITLIK